MTTPRRREPSFFDYVGAAFNYKVPTPGLGGIPVNYLYLALGAGLSVAAWPLSMFFAAGELAYLFGLASNPRFQKAIKARLKYAAGQDNEETIHDESRRLSYYGGDFREFGTRCENIITIARQVLGPNASDMLATYETNLRQLRSMYVRLLRMREAMEAHFDETADERIQEQIDDIHLKIEDPNQPAVTRASEQRTLEILEKRLETHRQIRDQLLAIKAQATEMDTRLDLIHDQVLLSRSPEALSANVQVASDVMEQQSDWLRQHGELFEQMQVMQ